MNFLISDESNFSEKRKNIQNGGLAKLHILTDFDKTLTKAFINGEKVPSVISILRSSNILSEEYSKLANELASVYHSIELNLSIPEKERKEKMQEWWVKHFDLLIKSKLNKKHIQKVIRSNKIQLREGAKDFFNSLYKNKVPLVILSSAGLGVESIEGILKRDRVFYPNICIISNSFKWDKEGNAMGVKKPIIHVLNKDETSIKEFPEIYEMIKERKNVILLGDSLGDLGMIKGFDYDNLIKIGFLNEDIEKNLQNYKKEFDILILNDGSMTCINNLLGDIK